MFISYPKFEVKTFGNFEINRFARNFPVKTHYQVGVLPASFSELFKAAIS